MEGYVCRFVYEGDFLSTKITINFDVEEYLFALSNSIRISNVVNNLSLLNLVSLSDWPLAVIPEDCSNWHSYKSLLTGIFVVWREWKIDCCWALIRDGGSFYGTTLSTGKYTCSFCQNIQTLGTDFVWWPHSGKLVTPLSLCLFTLAENICIVEG